MDIMEDREFDNVLGRYCNREHIRDLKRFADSTFSKRAYEKVLYMISEMELDDLTEFLGEFGISENTARAIYYEIAI